MKELEKTVETLTKAIERLEKLRLHSVSHGSGQVTESIFSGKSSIIPMADVQHIERHWYGDRERTKDNYKGIVVITKHTTWSQEMDTWKNNIYLDREEADKFISAWCMYRHELEKHTLMEMP